MEEDIKRGCLGATNAGPSMPCVNFLRQTLAFE